MARNTRNLSSINISEIVIEGRDSNTTARLTFENNRLVFKNTRTGEELLVLDSENNEVSFSSPLKLPDGSLLNTINDVNVRDLEIRASSPVVVFGTDEQPKNPNEVVTIAAVLNGLQQETAVFTTEPQIELGGTGNIRTLYPASLGGINSVKITATADEFSESITITKLSEGSNGISVVVSNPTDIIATDADGTVYEADIQNANGVFTLYKGTTNLTQLGHVVYSVDNVTNMSITINNNGEYQVTSFDNDANKGSATLIALYEGTQYPFVYKIVKAKQGATGQAGATGEAGESPYVGVVTDENIFIQTINNNNVANIATEAVTDFNSVLKLNETVGTFEVYRGTQKVTSNISFYIDEIGTQTTQTKNNLTFTINNTTGQYYATINTRIVQETNGWNSENETFVVRALINGVLASSRKIKIQKTKIGQDGKTGPSLKLNVRPNIFRFNGEGVPAENGQALTIDLQSRNIPDGYTTSITSDPALVIGGSGLTDRTLNVSNFIDSEGQYLDSAVIRAQVLDDQNELYLEDFVTIYRTQNGTDAKSLVLSSDSQVFSFSNDNDSGLNTDFVTVTAKAQNLVQDLTISDFTVTDSQGNTIDISLNTLTNNGDGSFSLQISLEDLGVSSTSTRDSIFPVKIRVEKEEVYDVLSIHKLIGGTDAVTGFLTNESDQIPAFADGTTLVEDYSTLNGTFQVYQGTSELTTGVSYSVVYEENISVSINSSTGFYSVTPESFSAAANVGRAILQAQYEGVTIQKVFTVSKTKQGKNTISVVLSNETHTIRAESDGKLILLNDLLSAGGAVYLYDGDERVTVSSTDKASYYVMYGDADAAESGPYYDSSGLRFTINQNTGVYSLSIPSDGVSGWNGDTEVFHIKIVYKNTTVFKTYTITKSKGGADALLMTLRGNRLVFTFDSDNNASPSNQEIILTASPTKGNTPIEGDIVWTTTPSNFVTYLSDITGEPNKKKIAIADFRTQNLTDVSITAEIDGLSDTVTIVKAKDGSTGENAKTIKLSSTANVVKYDDENDLTPDQSIITIFVDQQNLTNALQTTDITITKADSSTFNPSVLEADAEAGDVYFQITVGEGYEVEKADFPIKIQASSENVKDILTINKIEGGANGEDAVTVFLTNESHTVPAEADGAVSNDVLADAGGSVEFYKGLNKITENISFSIVGGTDSATVSYFENNGLRFEINKTTGVYSLSNVTGTSWSANYQTFTVRSTFDGASYDKIYTITKSKEGQAGQTGPAGASGVSPVNGLLTNESHTVVASDSGVVSSLTNAGGFFNVYRGTTDISTDSNVTYSVVQSTKNGLTIAFDNTTKNKYVITQTNWSSDNETFVLQAVIDGTTTIQKTYTIAKSKGGVNAKYIILEATKQTFDKIYSNDSPAFLPASQQITLTANLYNLDENELEWYIDGQPISAADTTLATVNGTSISVNQNQFDTARGENLSITVKALITLGSVSYSDQVTLILNQQGRDGATGRAGKTVKLTSDDYQIAYKQNGASDQWRHEPQSVTLTAEPFSVDDTKTITYKFYVNSTTAEARDDDTSPQFVINNFEDSYASFQKRNVKVEVLEDGEVVATDTVVIFATKDGEDSITINLTNSSHSFPADNFGTVDVSSYDTGTTEIEVYIGNTQLNPDNTSTTFEQMSNNTFRILSATGTNISAGSVSSATISSKALVTAAPSSMNDGIDFASILFQIQAKDSNGVERVIKQTQSFTKSKRGDDGLPAKALFLLSDSETFYLNKEGQNINSTINFSIIKENITSTVTFTTSPTVTLTGTGETRQLSYTNFGSNSSVLVTATVVEDGVTYTDSVTIGKVESGADGDNAKTVKLQSNDYQIAYNEAGASPSPTAITLTATQQQHEGTVYYQFLEGTTSRQNTTTSTYTYTLPTSKFDTPKTFKVQTREGSSSGTIIASDSITVSATKDGSNAITVVVTNENHTFSADEFGNVLDYSGGGTDIEVYIGNTALTPTFSTSAAAGQFRISNSPATGITKGSFSISGNKIVLGNPSNMSADTASITLSIYVVNSAGVGQTFNKVLSYGKSKKGADGFDERIYNFSKTYNDNGKLRAMGWKASARLSGIYQTDIANVTYSGEGEVITDTGASFGGTVLKLNSITDGDSNVYTDLIPVNTDLTYELKVRIKRSGTITAGKIFVIHYDQNKNFLTGHVTFYDVVSATDNTWVSYNAFIKGEGTPVAPSNGGSTVFKTGTKYVRLLIDNDFNTSYNSNIYLDIFSLKEATAYVDETGRTTEESSLNNITKTSSTYPYDPPTPRIGDVWIIPGTRTQEEKVYSYIEKTYDFSSAQDLLQAANTTEVGVAMTQNASILSVLKSNVAFYFIKGVGVWGFNEDFTPREAPVYLLRNNYNSDPGQYVEFANDFYGPLTVTVRYTPLYYNDSKYNIGDQAMFSWNNDANVDPLISLICQYKNDGGSWQNSFIARKNDNNFDTNDPLGYTKTFTISPTASSKKVNLRFGMSYQYNPNFSTYRPGWAIRSITITGFQQNVDRSITTKLYDLAIQSSKTFKTFTGQHLCIPADNTEYNTGLLVSSTGHYNNMNYENTDLENKITAQEAVPVVKLSDKEKDKSVIGVVCKEWEMWKYKDSVFKTDGFAEEGEYKKRYEINSLGEGGIWVTNYNGSLENGDYITSSPIPGYGMKQDDDILRNYTVAKITCDCDFSLDSEVYECEEFEHSGSVYRRAFVGCTYHCG